MQVGTHIFMQNTKHEIFGMVQETNKSQKLDFLLK